MSGLRDYKPLRLMAGDEEDLKAISTCLQDSISKMGDFAFLNDQRRFAFVANRFVWEAEGRKKNGPFARVRVGIHFDDVLKVQQQNIRTDAKEAVLSLLAIQYDRENDKDPEDTVGIISLFFSGGGTIRLHVEAINAHMNDISEPWRTRSKPEHHD